jgi:cytochrome c biogenesis protein CcmG/thiol:disulfide interchange protein DsbE
VKRLWPFAPLVLLVGLALIFAGMLMRGGGERGFSRTGLVGAPAPDYTLPRLDGAGQLTKQTFAGRPHLVNFFASWCVPCRQEHPLLEKLAADGVVIIGVAYKDQPQNARAMLADLGDPFAAIGLDPDGRAGLDFGVTGVPETLVIGADGKIVALHRGPLDEAALKNKILPALRGRAP